MPTNATWRDDLPTFVRLLCIGFHCESIAPKFSICGKTCPLLPGWYVSFFTVRVMAEIATLRENLPNFSQDATDRFLLWR